MIRYLLRAWKPYVLAIFCLAAGVFSSAVAETSDIAGELEKVRLFYIPKDDRSIRYLAQIFGDVGGLLHNPGGSQLMGELFVIFNLSMWVLAGFFVLYATISSIVFTTQDGGGMGGQGKMNSWVAVRVVAGTAMLIPKFSGYSFIQYLVMWTVLQGVGMADAVWESGLNYLKEHGGVIYTPPKISDFTNMSTITEKVIEPLFQAMVCQESLRLLDRDLVNEGETRSPKYGPLNDNLSGNADSYEMEIGGALTKKNTNNKVTSYICKTFKPDGGLTDYNKSIVKLALRSAAIDLQSSARGVAKDLVKWRQEDKSGYNNNKGQETAVRNKFCSRVAKSDDCPMGRKFLTAANSYYAIVKRGIDRACSQADDRKSKSQTDDTWMDQAKGYGWLTVARYYFDLDEMQANTEHKCELKVDGANNFLASPVVGAGNQSYYGTLSSEAKKIRDVVGDAFKGYNVIRLSGILTKSSDKLNNAIRKASDLCVGVDCTTKDKVTGKILDKVTGAMLEDLDSDINQSATSIFSYLRSASLPISDKGSIYSQGSQGFFATTIYVGEVEKTGENYSLEIPRILLTSMLLKIAFEIAGIRYEEAKFDNKDEVTANGINGGPEFKVNISRCASATSMTELNGKDTNIYSGSIPNDVNGSGCINNGKCIAKLYDSDCIASYSALRGKEGFDPVKANYGIIGAIVTNLEGHRVDPLLQARNLGRAIIESVTYFWTASIANVYQTMVNIMHGMIWRMILTSTMTSLAAGLVSVATGFDFLAGPIASIGSTLNVIMMMNFMLNKVALTFYLPIGTAISLPLITVGIMLGIYLPLVPFIIFSFAVLGWMVAVIEAMIAAPLVALGVTHPQGHDLLGKSEQSVMLLMSVFLRPVTLVIGFFAAMTISYIALGMFNLGFLQVIDGMLSTNSADEVAIANLISFFGILMVYTYTIIEVINFCYGLIIQIPDKIMRWVGGPADNQAQQIQQILGQVGGQTGQAAQAGAQGVGSAAGTASSAQVSPIAIKAEFSKEDKAKIKSMRSTKAGAAAANKDNVGSGNGAK